MRKRQRTAALQELAYSTGSSGAGDFGVDDAVLGNLLTAIYAKLSHFRMDGGRSLCHETRLFSLEQPYLFVSRPHMDTVIASKEVNVERKRFLIELRENARGRFLRITEDAHGRRNTVIVPSTGLNEFMTAADEVCAHANEPGGSAEAGPGEGA